MTDDSLKKHVGQQLHELCNRINATLLDITTNNHSETYLKNLSNVLALISYISNQQISNDKYDAILLKIRELNYNSVDPDGGTVS